MSVLKALFGNPGLKLLSLLLACALWALVRGQVVQSMDLRMPLEVELEFDARGETQLKYAFLDAKERLHNGPLTLNVKLEGPTAGLDNLRAANPVVRLVLRESDLYERVQRDITVGKSDLRYSRAIESGESASVLSIEPEELRIRLWRVRRETVAVNSNIQIDGQDEKFKIVILNPRPSQVLVSGHPEHMPNEVSLILSSAAVREIRTNHGNQMRDEVNVRFALVEDPERPVTVLDPTQLDGRVLVTLTDTQERDVEVRLVQSPGEPRKLGFDEVNDVEPYWIGKQPPTLRASFIGTPSALGDLATAPLRAFVYMSALSSDKGSEELPVEFLGLPDGVRPEREYRAAIEIVGR